jgi:glycosyltransferase involved in cell wall biosynthesis
MYAIFIITAAVILVYLSYPLWLRAVANGTRPAKPAAGEIDGVSLILLSYNGREYLAEKIRVLLDELKAFPNHELIIIDDHSSDGSQEVLRKFEGIPNIRLVLKEVHKGIPHTMNMAAALAGYEYLIFCDQRQEASRNILRKLVEPLGQEEIGAVSACISHIDKNGCGSLIRRYENYLKAGESHAGSLMGVYGPLYAMKKSCYSPIPESIILDDLYLSLKVMASKKISILEDCRIYDEHICTLTDYRRIQRYLSGFLQILGDRALLRHLPGRQLTMLIWHKYIRLLIPVFLCLCYFTTGILSFYHPGYIVFFALLTLVGIASLTPFFSGLKNVMIHFVRINVLYVIAMAQLILKVEH